MALTDNPLKSRKFWVTVLTPVAILVSYYLDVELDIAGLASIAAIIVTWLWKQGDIDKVEVECEARKELQESQKDYYTGV